jgi:curved DNA-binding protein CbpA
MAYRHGMTGKRDAYAILQIDPLAVPEVVEAAFRALARLRHPDHEPGSTGRAMAELNDAYAVLRDPAQRAVYDRERQPKAPVPSFLHDRVAAGPAAARRPGTADATPIIDFGRYAGASLGEVARTDPDYLRWLKRHSSGIRYRRIIDDMLGPPVAPRPVERARRRR